MGDVNFPYVFYNDQCNGGIGSGRIFQNDGTSACSMCEKFNAKGKEVVTRQDSVCTALL